jgi:hypothetical protein
MQKYKGADDGLRQVKGTFETSPLFAKFVG